MKKTYLIEEDFEYRGFRCAVIGQQLGHRCGYVGLPEGHKYYGEDYDEIPLDCHGGLTFSRESDTYPVKSEKPLWWIGFDCAHYNDGKDKELLKALGITKEEHPLYYDDMFGGREHVWTKEEVILEVKKMIDQLLMPALCE